MKLSERAAGRANNFDVLRLAAAALVLCSHSFVLTGHSEPRIGELALGTLGVVVFFGISGFLIARSWTLRPSLRAFAIKRGAAHRARLRARAGRLRLRARTDRHDAVAGRAT